MPLPLKYQFAQSGTNSTYQGWLEGELSKLQAELEVEKLTDTQQLKEAIAVVRDNTGLLMSTDRESFWLKLAAMEATASV